MSVRALSAVFDHSESTEGSRLVMLALADRADEFGYCWPSLTELARKTRLSRKSVTVALAKLEKTGELRRAQNHHAPANPREQKLSRGQKTTSYEIRVGYLASEPSSLPSQPELVNLVHHQPPEASEPGDQKLVNLARRSKGIRRHTEPSQERSPSTTTQVAAPEWFVHLWNEKAGHGVAKVIQLTKARQRLAQAAWRAHPDPAWWRAALERAHRSRFLRGAKGWTMNFDWFLKGDNAVRVMEGVHDNKEGDFREAREEAQAIIRRTGGYCHHRPRCADREEHLERVMDGVLGLRETLDAAAAPAE